MTKQTKLTLRTARKLLQEYRATGYPIPSHRVAKMLQSITDDCPLAHYRINQLQNKNKNITK